MTSLSKNVNRCCRRVCLASRQVHIQSSASEKSRGEAEMNPSKMSTRLQLRNMSAGQWKLLNQLKEYLTKPSNENGIFFVLNKEWISLLHKIPAIYGQGVTNTPQKLESVTTPQAYSVEPSKHASDRQGQDKNVRAEITELSKAPTKTVTVDLPVLEGQSYTFPQVLNGLKLKINPNQKVEELSESESISSRWKPNQESISKTSISSRTKHIISSIATSQSVQSRLKRLDDLTCHLSQYPEAKNVAVKEGAIRMLLQLRHETDVHDEATYATMREAFAMLGYVDPLPGRGIRILSIDGGGIRGVLVIEMLKKLEQLTGKRVYEIFDYICGVSTGSILASLIGVQRKNLDEVSVLYKELSTKIFTQNTFWGTSNLVWSHSYYDTEMWENLLKTYLGEMPMIQTVRDPNVPKVSSISTVVNKARVLAYIFRNYSLPYRVQSQYMGGHHHRLWESARASAAAPLYFEEFRIGDLLHQDGGILVNNPTAVAIHEARQLWPSSSIQCVVSLGTGRFNPVHNTPEEVNTSASSWKTKFLKILDSATDTEAVHTVLNDLMPPTVYHRFNPYITEMVTMDEICPEKISLLETDAAMYYRRNEDKFQATAQALLEKRTITQHCQDWINLQREILL